MLHFVVLSSYQKTSRNSKTSHTIAKKKATCIFSQPPSKKTKRNKCLYILSIANLPHPLLPFPFPVNVRTNILMNNTNDNQNSSNKSVGYGACVCVLFFCFTPAWVVSSFLFYTSLGNFSFLFLLHCFTLSMHLHIHTALGTNVYWGRLG